MYTIIARCAIEEIMSSETMPVTATNWFEVYTPDVAAARNFYSAVFGWTSAKWEEMAEANYYMLDGPQGTFAGFMDLNQPNFEHVPPHWMAYLHTDNFDATLAKALELGATQVWGPVEVPNVGRMGGIQDPFGAHISFHQPSGEREVSQTPVNWIEHMSGDRAGAVQFYNALCGWTNNDIPMGEEVGIYSMWQWKDQTIAGCGQCPEGHPAWVIYLHSDDIDATLEKVTAAGGSICNGKMSIGEFGHIAIVQDCCGAVFGLHQPPTMG